jgi:transcriptional regulator with XRE-family HTH domain
MLERGHRVPRVTTLLKIASSLEVSMDELIEGIK